MNRIIKIASAVAMSIAFTGTAYASPVIVTNPSFETPKLPVNTYQGDGTAANGPYGPSYAVGWTGVNGATNGAQHFDTSFTPSAGSQVLYVNSGGVFQDVGALLANHTYRLTVAVGNQAPFGPGSTGTISLLNGSNLLASTAVSGQPINSMIDFTTIFKTGNTVSGNLGIQLSKDSDQQLLFDNVRLIAAVPEPATWAMMIGGFGVVGGAMRARRRSVGKLANA